MHVRARAHGHAHADAHVRCTLRSRPSSRCRHWAAPRASSWTGAVASRTRCRSTMVACCRVPLRA
eukprot:11211211-Lingulodinium_polyedra.AAC.1